MKRPKMALTCRCKVAKCPTCLECSRCGCEHDGKSIEEKMRRGVGKPRGIKNKKRASKKRTREVDYNEHLIEGTPEEYNKDHVTITSGQDLSILRACLELQDYRVDHFPSLKTRLHDIGRGKTAMISFAVESIKRVCDLVYPPGGNQFIGDVMKGLSKNFEDVAFGSDIVGE